MKFAEEEKKIGSFFFFLQSNSYKSENKRTIEDLKFKKKKD